MLIMASNGIMTNDIVNPALHINIQKYSYHKINFIDWTNSH